MGLFSSKFITRVGTSVSRVIPDEYLPNSVTSGSLRAIFQEADIGRGIVEEMFRSIGLRAKAMYNYGRNGYTFGTPSLDVVSNVVGEVEVKTVLDALEGAPVTIDYVHMGPPNLLHIAWFKLVRDHGYNPNTNKLGALSTSLGYDVFVDDMVIVLPEATADTYNGTAVAQWGAAARSRPSPTRPASSFNPDLARLLTVTPIEISEIATEDHVRVIYAYTDSVGDVQTDSFTVTNSEYDEDKDYFQVAYMVGPVLKYWDYEVGGGLYEDLDDLILTPGASLGTFLPYIHFRHNKVSMDSAPMSTEYIHSQRMARKLGINYEDVLAALNENPDIADVEQAYMGFLVPANTADSLQERYLFDFFDRARGTSLGQLLAPTVWETFLGEQQIPGEPKYEVNRSLVLIQDTRVKSSLGTSGITKTQVAGRLGPIGTHDSGFVIANDYNKYHYYRKQITNTVYDEIRVFNLESSYYFNGGQVSSGEKDDDALLIPIDLDIARGYTLTDQEKLYAMSLNLVANALVTVKLSWYQTLWFKGLLMFVGIFLMAWDGGFTSSLAAAIAAGVGAFIQFIVITALVAWGVSYAFKLLVEAVGVDLALILAIIAAAYGIYTNYTGGAFASDMLRASTNLSKAASDVTKDALQDVQSEFEAFQDEAERIQKQIEQAQDLLATNHKLEPTVIFGETPGNYFKRTVHAGNIGTIGYQALHSYVDMALTLPTIADSIGDLNELS